jgi:two-component system, OmpR family, sensor histidine kinase KdpD
VLTDRSDRRWGRPTLRAVAVGVLSIVVAALLAAGTIEGLGSASSVAVFMLAVTIAAVSGGLWGGVLAAILASVALPFVEDPDRTLRFDEARDLIAAVVFLAIAVVVGLLVGTAADERARASKREREARLLGTLSTKMLSEVPDRVLDEFVGLVLEAFGLASCRVDVTLDGTPVHAVAVRGDERGGGPTEVVPVVVASVALGTLIAERPAGRRPFSRDERLLLEAATRQAAIALDRARLDARARLAQLDAETNQLRAAMFSSVTHDLRTPLASIKAGVTSLLDHEAHHDPTQQRELLLTVLEETDRLNRLVGNILDLAKIRAGALIPRRVRSSIDEIAEAVVARIKPRAGDILIELMFSPTLPEAAVDPVQVDQVLTNLVENAVRHSPVGGTVRVHLAQTGDAVRIRVTDEGPGIAPEEREKVFEPFYRGAEAPESAGSGLGLAIVRAIVTAHGGRIWVEETTRGGTAFVVDLPLEETVL